MKRRRTPPLQRNRKPLLEAYVESNGKRLNSIGRPREGYLFYESKQRESSVTKKKTKRELNDNLRIAALLGESTEPEVSIIN